MIGINTAILGGTNIGIGFALPISRAKAMLDDYRSGKSFHRARLGLTVVYVAGDWAEALDLPAQGGLLVQEVNIGSAAEAAGVRGYRQVVVIGNARVGVGGDLIMAIDGKPVDSQDALSRALARKRGGDSMMLTLYRNGRTVQGENHPRRGSRRPRLTISGGKGRGRATGLDAVNSLRCTGV